MLLRRVANEFGGFALLMAAGLLLGDIILVLLSLAPLFFVVLSLRRGPPSGVMVRRKAERGAVTVGAALRVESTVRADQGVGIVTVGDALPPQFRLTEGSNFFVMWKGPGPLAKDASYGVACTKRGSYTVGPFRMEAMDHAGMRQTTFAIDSSQAELLVQEEPISLRRMRDPRLMSRFPMPIGTHSSLGTVTTDFKEIREYRMHDNFHDINWKATARLAASSGAPPLVNEFEREGRRVVWIFLDTDERLRIGTEVENAFEHAVEAVAGLSQIYLDRNCRVGVCFQGSGHVILPESGRRQKEIILRSLVDVQMTRTRRRLDEAVSALKGHIAGTSPLFLAVTMLRADNAGELADGVREMRHHSGRHSRFIVLHVNGYEVAASGEIEEAGARILDLEMMPLFADLRKVGTQVLSWNPRTQNLPRMMAGYGRRRA
jgi:uncharacterized protein (DUF58 family)